MDEKEESENEVWGGGAFIETLGPQDVEEKMKTFHKKHDEDMNYNCKKCDKKISAHNGDWHDHMCDSCFNSLYLNED